MAKVAVADTVAAAAAVVGGLVVRALVGVVGKQRLDAIVGLSAVKREEATAMAVAGAEAQHTTVNSSSCNNKNSNNTPTSWLVKFTKRSY